MSSVIGTDEIGLSQLLEVLASFQIEACMFGVALVCFQFLHRRLLEDRRKSKVSPSKPMVRTSVPISVPVALPAGQLTERDYSELIKACGEAHEVDLARELWSEMVASQANDKAALGSMVEVLVSNRCTAEAWKVVKCVREGDADAMQHLKDQIQIYSTLLRGFAKAQQHNEVWALFSEMRAQSVPMNTITFNTVLNSMTRIGRIQEIPEFLETMRVEGPRGAPDTVTFSTIIKGYCQAGDMDAALGLLDVMSEMKVKADEFTFNALLEGCVTHRRLKEALRLLDLMQELGLPPSNHTLCVAVKVLGRMHRLGQAFAMVEDVSKAHGVRPNIQVYTCLMQACFHSRRIRKAFDLYNKVVEQGLVSVDSKMYTVLARGCLSCGATDKAAMVLRVAYRLPCSGSLLAVEGRLHGISADCLKEVLAELRRQRPEEADALEADIAVCVAPPRRRQ